MQSFSKATLLIAILASRAPNCYGFVPTSSRSNSANNVKRQMSAVSPEDEKTSFLDQFQKYGEESRPYRRTVYSHEDWVRHRSPDRFARNLSTFASSGIYKSLFKEVVATSTVASFVVVWNMIFGDYQGLDGVTHEGIMHDSLLPILSLPLSPFTLSSPSLGLLLVFRTNTSYKRWDEARKNWGMNINHTRDLVRMGNAYYDRRARSEEEAKEDLDRLALCTWAFVRSMKRHLSPEWEDEEAFQKELKEKLPEEQAQKILDAAHRPNRALQDLSTAIENLPMHFMRRDEIHGAATIFEDNLGSSERLLTSPIPVVYSRHTARFLSFWLLLLPLGLWGPLGNTWNHIGLIPTISMLSIFLFGIEELATSLEEPFTILPMQAFCDKIYNWCTEIVSFKPGDNGMPTYYYSNYNADLEYDSNNLAKPIVSELEVEKKPRDIEVTPELLLDLEETEEEANSTREISLDAFAVEDFVESEEDEVAVDEERSNVSEEFESQSVSMDDSSFSENSREIDIADLPIVGTDLEVLSDASSLIADSTAQKGFFLSADAPVTSVTSVMQVQEAVSMDQEVEKAIGEPNALGELSKEAKSDQDQKEESSVENVVATDVINEKVLDSEEGKPLEPIAEEDVEEPDELETVVQKFEARKVQMENPLIENAMATDVIDEEELDSEEEESDIFEESEILRKVREDMEAAAAKFQMEDEERSIKIEGSPELMAEIAESEILRRAMEDMKAAAAKFQMEDDDIIRKTDTLPELVADLEDAIDDFEELDSDEFGPGPELEGISNFESSADPSFDSNEQNVVGAERSIALPPETETLLADKDGFDKVAEEANVQVEDIEFDNGLVNGHTSVQESAKVASTEVVTEELATVPEEATVQVEEPVDELPNEEIDEDESVEATSKLVDEEELDRFVAESNEQDEEADTVEGLPTLPNEESSVSESLEAALSTTDTEQLDSIIEETTSQVEDAETSVVMPNGESDAEEEYVLDAVAEEIVLEVEDVEILDVLPNGEIDVQEESAAVEPNTELAALQPSEVTENAIVKIDESTNGDNKQKGGELRVSGMQSWQSNMLL